MDINKYSVEEVLNLDGSLVGDKIPKKGVYVVRLEREKGRPAESCFAVVKDRKLLGGCFADAVFRMDWIEEDGETRFLKLGREATFEFERGEDTGVKIRDFREEKKVKDEKRKAAERKCEIWDILDIKTGKLLFSDSGRKINIGNVAMDSFRDDRHGLICVTVRPDPMRNAIPPGVSYKRTVTFFDSKDGHLLGAFREIVRNDIFYRENMVGAYHLEDGRDIVLIKDRQATTLSSHPEEAKGKKWELAVKDDTANVNFVFDLGNGEERKILLQSDYNYCPLPSYSEGFAALYVPSKSGRCIIGALNLKENRMLVPDPMVVEDKGFHYDRKRNAVFISNKEEGNGVKGDRKPYKEWEIYDTKGNFLFKDTGCLLYLRLEEGDPYMVKESGTGMGERIYRIDGNQILHETPTDLKDNRIVDWTCSGHGSVVVDGYFMPTESVKDGKVNFLYRRRNPQGLSYLENLFPEGIPKEIYEKRTSRDLHGAAVDTGAPTLLHSMRLDGDISLVLDDSDREKPFTFYHVGKDKMTELVPINNGKGPKVPESEADETPSPKGTWKMDDPLSGCAYFDREGNQITPWFDYGEPFSENRGVALVGKMSGEGMERETHGLKLESVRKMEYNYLREDGSLVLGEWTEKAKPFGKKNVAEFEADGKRMEITSAGTVREKKAEEAKSKGEEKKESRKRFFFRRKM